MTEYTCDSFRFFNLFPVYFGGKGTVFDDLLNIFSQFMIDDFPTVLRGKDDMVLAYPFRMC